MVVNLLVLMKNNIIQYEEIIANSLYDRCYPSILPEIYSVRVAQKFLLVCRFLSVITQALLSET